MPVKYRLSDHSVEVSAKVAAFADLLMGTMAAQIEAQMKTGGKVPFLPVSTKWAQRGALRASIRSQRKGMAKYVVTAGTGSPAAEYAAAQEAGMTRGHQMKNYSTPGTGPHWFQDAVDTVTGRYLGYIEQTKSAVGL